MSRVGGIAEQLRRAKRLVPHSKELAQGEVSLLGRFDDIWRKRGMERPRELTLLEFADLKVVFDKGISDCSVCNGTRYQKIVPVIGILPFDEKLRDLLLDKEQPGKVVREELRKKRVTTMIKQVLELVRQGVASIEAMEVLNHG